MAPKVMDAPATTGARQEDIFDALHELGTGFAARAVDVDRDGDFVAENYAELKRAQFFSAGIPEELGGGGASHETLCGLIREMARYDGSTALAYAMHTHPVLANVYKARRGDPKAEAALRKIAAGELVIAGTGATDWLSSSGNAERVEGGFRVSAQKRFVSGSVGGDLFVTSARYEGPAGPEVIHFAVPFSHEAVRVHDNWDALGMRGTGSGNVTIEDLFVSDESIVVRRPADVWHSMWDVIPPIALPLIVSAYVGLAEEAADLAIAAAEKSGSDEYAPEVGAMLNQLTIARLALDDMIRAADNLDFDPVPFGTAETLTRKAIATEAVKAVIEHASDLVGGKGFMRGDAMERIVRDARAMHYHPLPERKQRRFVGMLALGLEPV